MVKLGTYFMPLATVSCNIDLSVPITTLNYINLPVSTSSSGLCVGYILVNDANLTDSNETNFATAITVLGAVTHSF